MPWGVIRDGQQCRGGNKGLFVLLSRTQAGPSRTVKQEQEDISRNHVRASKPTSLQSGGQAKEPAVCMRGGVPAAAAQDGGGIIHFIAFGLDLTGAHLIWSCPLPF